ncbi:MAG: hypothetical protein JXR78_01370 [Victivallales bacterium]|nr:hypothetical protein [Victivallales bacterium]
MNEIINHNLGEQPITSLMERHELTAHDLVAASTQQLTHKMVGKACKGRRLTTNIKMKVRNAISQAVGKEYKLTELFDY